MLWMWESQASSARFPPKRRDEPDNEQGLGADQNESAAATWSTLYYLQHLATCSPSHVISSLCILIEMLGVPPSLACLLLLHLHHRTFLFFCFALRRWCKCSKILYVVFVFSFCFSVLHLRTTGFCVCMLYLDFRATLQGCVCVFCLCLCFQLHHNFSMFQWSLHSKMLISCFSSAFELLLLQS